MKMKTRAALRMRAALVAAMIVTLALTLSTSARAATITVDSLADTGAPGICVLRDAITAANTMAATNGCAAGTGNDTIQFSVRGTIMLSSTLPQITDSHLTINGPTSPGITLDGGHKVQVMQVASSARVILNRLTIADGKSGNGGGIYNDGTLTVVHSTFSTNRSSSVGGGIGNASTLTVINSSFSGNSAANSGGGINSFAVNPVPTLTVTNSTFSGNSAALGGGIDSAFSIAIITNSTFSGNNSARLGGGINSDDALLTVINSTFSGNSAAESGGGIANELSPLTVTNSTFSSNSARYDGGGIYNGEMLTVTTSTFSGNSSATAGGGIYNDGTLTVTTSTFSGNSSATTSGGSIFNSPGERTRIKSTILAASGSGGNCSGTIADAGYNISDDSSCKFSATGSLNNTDPMLDPAGLGNNSGPTQTIALLSGSPAIDAIPLADCTDLASPPNPIITDQRLFPRPDAGETNCDIGAYEVQDTAFVPFSRFHGGLRIHPDTGVLLLSGGFKLGAGGSIDARTQPAAFGIGSYALRLPAGSFVGNGNGYVYQKAVNGIFLCIFIKFTDTPGSYQLLVYRKGGTLPTSSEPVTLTIGDDSGSTLMNAKFQKAFDSRSGE